MDVVSLKKSAQFVVKRNVSERVVRVLATFEPTDGRLRLIYCTNGLPTDDDSEDCEIACAELIGEFSEISKAETKCLPSDEYASDNDDTEVFSRSLE